MVTAQVNAAPVFDVLIVGCGNIAGGFDLQRPDSALPLTHAGAFSQSAGFRLAACVEPDSVRREIFMTRWQIPLGFESLAQAGAHPIRPAVVSICSPTAAHSDGLQSALALRPRAIFCEKPVTPSVAETRKWVKACADAGVLLTVNHTRRWAPDIIRLKQQLDRGAWGALRSITGLYNKGILNNGSHLVDLVAYLAGPLTLVSAGPAIDDFWPGDPSVAALLQTGRSVPVNLSIAHAQDYTVFELQIVAARGLLSMENAGMSWRVRSPVDSPLVPGYRVLGRAEEIPGEYPHAMSAAVSNLYAALVDGAALASTGHGALQAQQLCEKIRDSAGAMHQSPP